VDAHSVDRVARPGNTALAGAAMVAADPRLAPRAKALAESITLLNLADPRPSPTPYKL